MEESDQKNVMRVGWEGKYKIRNSGRWTIKEKWDQTIKDLEYHSTEHRPYSLANGTLQKYNKYKVHNKYHIQSFSKSNIYIQT